MPVFVSRGVVQISAYVDQVLASWLGEGAVAALTNAQSIYTLPVSLFGMAVSAAELAGDVERAGHRSGNRGCACARRLNAGLRQIAFFIVPSAMAFFALGDVMTAALYQPGKFTHEDSVYVWGILAGSASDCWRRRSAASTLPRTMRCAIRGRRCATRRCASRSPSAWDTCAPCRFRAGSASIRIGARRG